MNATDGQPFKVYTEPDYHALEVVAKQLNVELTMDWRVREAEELFQQGLQPPTIIQGISPKEETYISQLLAAVSEKRILPAELQVYLVDRGILKDVPETDPTRYIRRLEQIAFSSRDKEK
jgi:hypothetical protein